MRPVLKSVFLQRAYLQPTYCLFSDIKKHPKTKHQHAVLPAVKVLHNLKLLQPA